MNLNEIHRWLKKFLNELYQQNHCRLRLRATDTVQIKRKSWGPTFYAQISYHTLHRVGDTTGLGTNIRALLSGSLIFFLVYYKLLTYPQGICLPQGSLFVVNDTYTPVEYYCYVNIKPLLVSLTVTYPESAV